MRVAVFTVPIARARAVRDGRRVRVCCVPSSQVGRRWWTFRHLRLWNTTSCRTSRCGSFRWRGAFWNDSRGGFSDGRPTRRPRCRRRCRRSSGRRQTSSRRRWTSRWSLRLMLLLVGTTNQGWSQAAGETRHADRSRTKRRGGTSHRRRSASSCYHCRRRRRRDTTTTPHQITTA